LQHAVRGKLAQKNPKAGIDTRQHADFYAQQNAVVRALVRLARRTVQGRELSKSRLVAVKRMFKQAYRELAFMMVQEKYLPDTDAIYFLTHSEIAECIQSPSPVWAERTAARRRAYDVQQALQFQDVFTGKPSPIKPDLSDLPADRLVRGRAVSRGCVTGRAKIARVVAEASKLEAGDILIAPITDVAWTPYFSLIGGLATDIGSAVSHGAVVAREYGLPAIVKTDIGTQVFQDGEVVVLDANNGILRPATRAETAAFMEVN
jgi:phosphohistidine swiveling domain-containing protein